MGRLREGLTPVCHFFASKQLLHPPVKRFQTAKTCLKVTLHCQGMELKIEGEGGGRKKSGAIFLVFCSDRCSLTHTVNLGIEMRHTENLTKLNMKKRQRLSKTFKEIF